MKQKVKSDVAYGRLISSVNLVAHINFGLL